MDVVWWGLAALLGVTAMWLPGLLNFGISPRARLIIAHAGLFLTGMITGFLKPTQAWRCGLGSVLLFPVAETTAIMIRPMDASLVESLPYLFVKLPVYALQALPALLGAYLSVYARSCASTWAGLRKWAGGARLWGLGFLLGFVVAGIPFLITQHMDPSRGGISYWVWEGSLFFSAMAMSFLQSTRGWRWGIAVGLGFPVAMLLDIMISVSRGTASGNLWPIAIFVSLVIAWPPAFAGAYFGVFLKRIFIRKS